MAAPSPREPASLTESALSAKNQPAASSERQPGAPLPSARKAWALFAALLAAGLGAAATIPGPEWRLDMWNVARHGHPRLLGVWSPAGLIAFWVAGVPLLLALFAGLLPKGRRSTAGGLFLSWSIISLALLAGDLLLRSQPALAPQGAIASYPYRGWARFPFGIRYFETDDATILRHWRGGSMPAPVDYGRDGDLLKGGFATPPGDSVPSRLFRETRRFNRHGFSADFGDFDAGSAPEPEVAFLGDSFTFGYCLNARQTWPALLLEDLAKRKLIGAKAPAGTDPLKLGAQFACGNYTPREGLLAFQIAAPLARPKIAVALYYAGNDLGDAKNNAFLRATGNTGTKPYEIALKRAPAGFLENDPVHGLLSWAFRPTDLRLPPEDRAEPWNLHERDPDELRRQRFKADPFLRGEPELLPKPGAKSPVPAIRPRRLKLGDKEAFMAISPYELADLCREPGWPARADGWKPLLEGLDELARFRAETGTRVLVAWAPSKLRANWPMLLEGELAGDEIQAFGEAVLGEGPSRPMREAGSWLPFVRERADILANAVSAECAARGLEFLDLAAPLREEAIRRGDSLYFPYDTHWSVEGHAAAASIIGERLGTLSAPEKP